MDFDVRGSSQSQGTEMLEDSSFRVSRGKGVHGVEVSLLGV